MWVHVQKMEMGEYQDSAMKEESIGIEDEVLIHIIWTIRVSVTMR